MLRTGDPAGDVRGEPIQVAVVNGRNAYQEGDSGEWRMGPEVLEVSFEYYIMEGERQLRLCVAGRPVRTPRDVPRSHETREGRIYERESWNAAA